MATVEFRVALDQGWPTVEPVVDGTALAELVGAHERGRGYAPAGEYGGFRPVVHVGGLPGYLRGDRRRRWPRRRRSSAVDLLGCECGEGGCWPLEAMVTVTDHVVTWSGFRQPHRRAWTYDGLGPFTFDRVQYDTAAAEAAAALDGGGS